jgi:hypothetical protein
MTAVAKPKHVYRVFLSHSVGDRVYADKLRRLLSKRPDVSVFSVETLSAGENWQSKLKDEISNCDIFAVIFSPNSVDSQWLLQELGAAWSLHKPIIPVVTQPNLLRKIPLTLQQTRVVNFNELEKPEDFDRWFESLEAAAAPK